MTVAFTRKQEQMLRIVANKRFEGKLGQMFREIVNFYELHHPEIFVEK